MPAHYIRPYRSHTVCGSLPQADDQTEQLVAALREEHEAELARLLDASVAQNGFVQQRPQVAPEAVLIAAAAAPPIGSGDVVGVNLYSREDRDGME